MYSGNVSVWFSRFIFSSLMFGFLSPLSNVQFGHWNQKQVSIICKSFKPYVFLEIVDIPCRGGTRGKEKRVSVCCESQKKGKVWAPEPLFFIASVSDRVSDDCFSCGQCSGLISPRETDPTGQLKPNDWRRELRISEVMLSRISLWSKVHHTSTLLSKSLSNCCCMCSLLFVSVSVEFNAAHMFSVPALLPGIFAE